MAAPASKHSGVRTGGAGGSPSYPSRRILWRGPARRVGPASRPDSRHALEALSKLGIPDKSQTSLHRWVSEARSAGFQPAVSPNSIRQTVRSGRGPQIGNLRYSRLKTCATSRPDRVWSRLFVIHSGYEVLKEPRKNDAARRPKTRCQRRGEVSAPSLPRCKFRLPAGRPCGYSPPAAYEWTDGQDVGMDGA
jgi:hypothetical protein